MGVQGGTRQGLCCRGGVRVHVCQDGQGACGSGQNESGWVRIGDSLTCCQLPGAGVDEVLSPILGALKGWSGTPWHQKLYRRDCRY